MRMQDFLYKKQVATGIYKYFRNDELRQDYRVVQRRHDNVRRY